MAQNCDDIFNRIQELERKKREAAESEQFLYSLEDTPPDPSRRFVTRTTDGKEVEVDFDELWKRIQVDDQLMGWARAASENGQKPYGADGQFENFGQLVDRLGFDNAVEAGAFMQKLTGNWAAADPGDFNLITARNSGENWGRMVNQAFTEAGLEPDDRLVQAVTLNAAPFLDILNKQVKLEVFAVVSRNNLVKSIEAIQQGITETGISPAQGLKQDFISNYRKAMYAHRSARLAKRRSGQLLANYKRAVDEDMALTLQGQVVDTPGDLTPQGKSNLAANNAATRIESQQDLNKVIEETIGVSTAEMVQEGSLAKQVIEASNKGAEGLEDLEQLKVDLQKEGVDPAGDNDFEDGWDKVWRRNARAGYKDSVLFNPKTQLQANYLSQKLVFLTEGYRTAGGQGPQLLAMRQTNLQKGLQDVAATAAIDDVNAIKITPLGTGFFRDALKAEIDGARIAGRAALVAEDVIKQSWGETIQKSFFGNDNAFAGNYDTFAGRGMLDIEEQYKVARSVLEEPMAPLSESYRWPMQLRNKFHHAIKLKGNENLWNARLPEGKVLPVYSSLQMMTAVDQRAGIRNYMTIRANDLMLEQAAKNPDGTLQQWADVARKQLDDQIYQDPPTPQNIQDARDQFNLSETDLTDDEVEEFIVATKLGMPVQANPAQRAAAKKSIDMRMQGEMEVPGLKSFNYGVANFRRSEWGDSFLSFWRSPINQIVWDVGIGLAPVNAVQRTLRVAGYAVQGKPVPVELLVKAQSSVVISGALLTMFAALDGQGAIEGNGPVDPRARRAWKERLAAEGKVPNSILGVPFPLGGVPILNTLFLYKDMKDVIDQGGVSEYDQQNAALDLVSLLGGVVMRIPGFSQIEQVFTALNQPGGNKPGQVASFWGNTQFNPASGIERLAEWAFGMQSSDLRRPNQMNTGEERFDLEQLEDGHPLRSVWNNLRDFTYYSNPAISHWAGSELKEATWLGRKVRRPDGIFRGEWPIGVPGIWEFNKGDYSVETELESLGMLDPPALIMRGVLQGVPVTEQARKELNYFMGSWRAPDIDEAYTETSRQHPSGRVYTADQIKLAPEEAGELPIAMKGASVDVTELLDRVVRGNTVREALNELINSPEYKEWNENPLMTWNPALVDLPPQQRRRRIGPELVKMVIDHYADNAAREFDLSGSQASDDWRDALKIKQLEESQGETQVEQMQDAFDAVVP